MKKTIQISIIALVVILVVTFILTFANSLFGNPISKKLAENTATEYIKENYPDDNCQIKDMYYDFKSEIYKVDIISTTNENINFDLGISQKGDIVLIDYKSMRQEESATPLTEDEIKEIFLEAHKLYVEWSSPVAKYLNKDWNKTITIDGVEYFEVVSNEITSVDELKNEYSKYFSEEIIKESIDKYYVMHNGKLYGNCVLVEGGDISWQKHKLIINKNTDTECTFTVISEYEGAERELSYTMKVKDGKWKFTDSFNCLTTEELVLE